MNKKLKRIKTKDPKNPISSQKVRWKQSKKIISSLHSSSKCQSL